MKERLLDLKERLSTDKKFKTQFVSIVTACVVVIATAIIVPVSVHNANLNKEEVDVNPSASESTTMYSITLTTRPVATMPNGEAVTDENGDVVYADEATTTEPATEAESTTVSTTKPQNTTTTTTRVSTTKAPATTKSNYQQLIEAGIPEKIARANENESSVYAINIWNSDERRVNDSSSFLCPYGCGKIGGSGTHGTCVRYTVSMNCNMCGVWVEKSTCHTCVY